jgi:hypothetical protein
MPAKFTSEGWISGYFASKYEPTTIVQRLVIKKLMINIIEAIILNGKF